MVISPEATEDEITASVERVSGLVTDGGGNVTEQDTWGLRRLAYPINKLNEGNYVMTRFTLDAGAVNELNRALRTSEDILRYAIMKV